LERSSSSKSSERYIRCATIADIPAIVALINEADQVYRAIIPPELWREPFVTKERLLQEWAEREYLVAMDGGEVVGVVCWEVIGPAAYLGRLFVHPSRQRQGIGRSLLETVESKAKRAGCRLISLIVNPKATWAVRFYEKHGYIKGEMDELGKWAEAIRERLPQGSDWMVMVNKHGGS